MLTQQMIKNVAIKVAIAILAIIWFAVWMLITNRGI